MKHTMEKIAEIIVRLEAKLKALIKNPPLQVDEWGDAGVAGGIATVIDELMLILEGVE